MARHPRPAQAPAAPPQGSPAGQASAPAKAAAPAAPPRPASPPAPATAPGGAPAAAGAPGSARLRGAAARTAVNMAASLGVPTATSVRSVPAKLLIDNRIVINNHLARGRGGKVSFTHLIGFAVVKALGAVPAMNHSYTELDGKPAIIEPEHVNLGLAIDVAGKDGSRQSPWCPRSRPRRRWTSASSGWRTRTWSGGPGPASSPWDDSTRAPRPA